MDESTRKQLSSIEEETLEKIAAFVDDIFTGVNDCAAFPEKVINLIGEDKNGRTITAFSKSSFVDRLAKHFEYKAPGLVVHLDYFNKNGTWKYEGGYTSEHTRNDPIFKIWDEIRSMFSKNIRPGMVNGRWEYNVLVDVPDHPNNHPHMIMSPK